MVRPEKPSILPLVVCVCGHNVKCIFVCEGLHVPQCECGGQRTTPGTGPFPSCLRQSFSHIPQRCILQSSCPVGIFSFLYFPSYCSSAESQTCATASGLPLVSLFYSHLHNGPPGVSSENHCRARAIRTTTYVM